MEQFMWPRNWVLATRTKMGPVSRTSGYNGHWQPVSRWWRWRSKTVVVQVTRYHVFSVWRCWTRGATLVHCPPRRAALTTLTA